MADGEQGSGQLPAGEPGSRAPARTSVVDALRELLPGTPPPPLSDVTMIPGRARVKEQYESLLTGAVEEVLVLDRPPYSWVMGVPNAVVLATARRVAIRALHQRSQFEDDDEAPWRREMAAYQAAGVVARVVDDVPRKLVVVDRRWVMASLVHPAIPSLSYPVTVLVDNERFAGAQGEFFESLWESSQPFPSR